jgi:hypothetical protein
MKSYAASLGRNCYQNNIPALAAGIARIQRWPNQFRSSPQLDSSTFNIPLTLLSESRTSSGFGGFGLDTAESKVENGRRFTGFLPHTSWFPGQYS